MGGRARAWAWAAWAALARNWLFLLVLVPAAVLREVAELGYRWQAYFPDSIGYLGSAVYDWPDAKRVAGYAVFLKLLRPFHSLAPVTISQHAMGLLTGVMIYLVARRLGAAKWLAVLATLPVLYDGFEIQLEHLVMSDTLFLFLVMLALTLLTWTPRPAWWACLIAGALLGTAAVVRSIGLPLVAVFALYLIVRLCPVPGRYTRAWRGWAALTAGLVCLALTFTLPLLAYARWYNERQHQFTMGDSTGVFLYARVMTFADCSRMAVTPDLARLCTTVPPAQRPVGQDYLWGSDSPLMKLGADEFSPQVNSLAQRFAVKAITAQPADYARVIADDTWHAFSWPRTPFPNSSTYDNYLFGQQNVEISATAGPGAKDGSTWSYAPNLYVNGDPRTTVAEPYATIIRVYQEYVWLPGTIYGLILLAGLSGLALAWRRAGGEGLLPWAVSLALIVVPAATAAFDYRYVLTAVPFACLAAAVTLARLRAPRAPAHRSPAHRLPAHGSPAPQLPAHGSPAPRLPAHGSPAHGSSAPWSPAHRPPAAMPPGHFQSRTSGMSSPNSRV